MVELKDRKIPIGMCSLISRDWNDAPDLGFALIPEFMGLGYAFEISKAMLDYAKSELKFKFIYSFTEPENIYSIKLIEKLGMKFIKVFGLTNDRDDLLLYKSDLT